MTRIDKRLAQLFKRVGFSDLDERIKNMPEDYQKGFVDGVYEGREAQRKADIQVAKKLLNSMENEYRERY